MPSANEQIIRDFFACESTQGLSAALKKHVAPNVVWWLLGFGEIQDKIPAFADLFERIFDSEGLRLTIVDMISEGDKLAVQAEGHGKLKTGAIYENFYHFLFELHDGKIVRVKEYLDTRRVVEAFGPYMAQMA